MHPGTIQSSSTSSSPAGSGSDAPGAPESGMAYAPSIQRPRSTSWHRLEQKGKVGRSASVAIAYEWEQIGQRPRIIQAVPFPPVEGFAGSLLAGAGDEDPDAEVEDEDDESAGLSAWALFLYDSLR